MHKTCAGIFSAPLCDILYTIFQVVLMPVINSGSPPAERSLVPGQRPSAGTQWERGLPAMLVTVKKPTRDMTNKGMPVTMHAVDRTAHRVQCP